MQTYFAPARRTDRRKFKNQVKEISHSPIMTALLNAVTGLIIVFNEDRQIVAVNHSFLKVMGISDPETALGLRLGEALNCVNACKPPAGCGTTPQCASCGAVIAMMAAIEDDREDEQICAFTSENNGVRSDICLRVFAKPIKVEKNRWILIFAEDITKQQFWVNMEHVFFHDINNLLTSLVGNLQLVAMQMPDREDIAQVRDTAERLCSEINIQKTLLYYKDAGYVVNRSSVSLNYIKKEFYLFISGHDALNSRRIEEDWPDSPDPRINTDAILVSRVLANMVINALEATDRGRAVRISVRINPDNVKWEIWNHKFIPSEIQRRIFQRHFSTKPGSGRGFGTYSMKLFGENYLNGKVSFTSSLDRGTSFIFQLPR